MGKTMPILTNMKEKRSQRGLFQRDVADVVPLSQSLVSKLENGKTTTTIDNLLKLAGVLGYLTAEFDGQKFVIAPVDEVIVKPTNIKAALEEKVCICDVLRGIMNHSNGMAEC